jgi:hypothetical protein
MVQQLAAILILLTLFKFEFASWPMRASQILLLFFPISKNQNKIELARKNCVTCKNFSEIPCPSFSPKKKDNSIKERSCLYDFLFFRFFFFTLL